MSVTLVGSVIVVSIMVGLGVYAWYLKNKLRVLESVSDTSEQDNKRIEAVEAQVDAKLDNEAVNVKTHAYDSDASDLMRELHNTVTSKPAT